MLTIKMQGWDRKLKSNLLDGWITQNLHHADKIYSVVATSIVYYIYKYKHLHLASYKYLQNNFRYQWTFNSTHSKSMPQLNKLDKDLLKPRQSRYEKKYSSDISHSVINKIG